MSKEIRVRLETKFKLGFQHSNFVFFLKNFYFFPQKFLSFFQKINKIYYFNFKNTTQTQLSNGLENIIDMCELVLKLGIKYSVLIFEATLCIYVCVRVCVCVHINIC